MKRQKALVGILIAGLGFSINSTAFAACPSGKVLKVIGSAQTANGASGDTNITTQGQMLHGVFVACTTTACTGTLYNSDGSANAGANTDANVRAEPGAPASQSDFLDLTESPIYFSDGITFHDAGNVLGIVLYTCAQP